MSAIKKIRVVLLLSVAAMVSVAPVSLSAQSAVVSAVSVSPVAVNVPAAAVPVVAASVALPAEVVPARSVATMFPAQVAVPTATAPAVFSKEARDSLWRSANDAYMNANYVDAIDRYEHITAQGWESPELYLNLGNAYFKRGMNGKAILNYNKALKMNPAFGDAKYNLSIANAQVQDDIDEIPVFFVKDWLRSIHRSLSGNAWAVLSLLFLALLLGSVLLYLLSERLSLQKTGFFAGVLFLLGVMVSVHFTSMSRKMERCPGEAIIMRSAVSVKSSPGDPGTELFILHEGTKVKVYGTIGEYREISIADGNRGWLPVSSFELID